MADRPLTYVPVSCVNLSIVYWFDPMLGKTPLTYVNSEHDYKAYDQHAHFFSEKWIVWFDLSIICELWPIIMDKSMRESIDLQTKYEVLLDIDKGVKYGLIAEIHG